MSIRSFILIIQFFILPFVIIAQEAHLNNLGFKEGILTGEDVKILIRLQEISEPESQLDQILEILDSDETPNRIKVAILEKYLNRQYLFFPKYVEWLQENINYKIERSVYDFNTFMFKSSYPVLKFLISLNDPLLFTPKDLIVSDMFSECDLFDGWYEKYKLKTLISDFIWLNYGSHFEELKTEDLKPCSASNLKYVIEDLRLIIRE